MLISISLFCIVPQEKRNKTKAELLAEERDYKRRRMSYRGKKLKRTPLQVYELSRLYFCLKSVSHTIFVCILLVMTEKAIVILSMFYNQFLEVR